MKLCIYHDLYISCLNKTDKKDADLHNRNQSIHDAMILILYSTGTMASRIIHILKSLDNDCIIKPLHVIVRMIHFNFMSWRTSG